MNLKPGGDLASIDGSHDGVRTRANGSNWLRGWPSTLLPTSSLKWAEVSKDARKAAARAAEAGSSCLVTSVALKTIKGSVSMEALS